MNNEIKFKGVILMLYWGFCFNNYNDNKYI